MDVLVPRAEVARIARAALRASGASEQITDLLVAAALFAEDRGKSGVGVAHLIDYLRGIDAGRMNPQPRPTLLRPAPGLISCDADGGPFHTGFAAAFVELAELARSQGIAAFTQSGAFAGGQLAWFTEQLATRGLIAVAAVNSPAMLAAAPGTPPVFGTNPLAYSFPLPDGAVATVDQASSASAFVNVRAAAAAATPIPPGWAVDADGSPTTDPEAAVDGALLPFGGYKGANIALLVELLATLSGANWSIDAPSFTAGSDSPGVGMFLLAIDPGAFGGDGFGRVDKHLRRLADLGVRTPTPTGPPATEFTVSAEVLRELRARAG